MRFRLRTLLIVIGVVPPVLAGASYFAAANSSKYITLFEIARMVWPLGVLVLGGTGISCLGMSARMHQARPLLHDILVACGASLCALCVCYLGFAVWFYSGFR